VYNRKGGVGKTTLTMNLGAYYFKRAHKRVLMIDFDTQASLSIALIRDRIEHVGGVTCPVSSDHG
jgi:cellulose biosynthesis protein BcsQ